MQLLQKLLNKLNGLRYPQEYLCLAKESFEETLHVYVVRDNRAIYDVSDSHLFIGYSPLVIALRSFGGIKPELPDDIQIYFSRHPLQPNDHLAKKDAIAWLSLRLIRRQSMGDTDIVYYECINGEHHFLSAFHQYVIGLNNNLYNNKPGNVFLHNSLYRQVQIAYSVPRVISLITVSDGQRFNLFPTDLHGPVNEQFYIDSLRLGGKACTQVEQAGKIVVSEIKTEAYKLAYSLGKNHMQELKDKDQFPFGNRISAVFQWPIPLGVLRYSELEWVDSFDHGIHKLMLFRIISRSVISDQADTLAHVHNVYATWRHNKGLAGNYLLR